MCLARQRFLGAAAHDARRATEDATPASVEAAPLVSVLIPARNEQHRILAECVGSILAQDYARFEVVAVNDRSIDATALILRALAATDARLRVVEGREPPAGWLGKPFALQQALEVSRGEWVLATDADMVFDPAALRTALEYARGRNSDALSLIPHFEAHSFWERVFIPTWGWGMLILYPLDLVNHPRSPLAVGIGGFILMRRAALEHVGGFGAVRAEVLDDFRLAGALKHSGARMLAEYAPRLARTRMYTDFRGLWESATKNWFAAHRFSLTLAAANLVWVFFVGLLPPLLAVFSGLMLLLGGGEFWRQLFVPAFSAWVVCVALLALINKRFGVPAVYALTAPLGWILCCAVLVSSAAGVLGGRGLVWKGRRFYERAGVRPPQGKR
ncbi:MAG: glycosyltransferase [Acidobacteria bacterium]|nr:glycosyltransferase [Acidobacteriota bacterium]